MKKKKIEILLVFLLYMTVTAISAAIAIIILRSNNKLSSDFLESNIAMHAIFPLIVSQSIAMSITLYDGKYSIQKKTLGSCYISSLKSSIALGGVWAIMLVIEKNDITESRYYFLLTLITFFAIMGISKYIFSYFFINDFYKSKYANYTAIICERENAERIVDFLKHDWSKKIIGIVLREKCDERNIDGIPIVCELEDFEDWARYSPVDEVFIATNDMEKTDLYNIVNSLRQMGIAVNIKLNRVMELNEAINKSDESKYLVENSSSMGYINRVPFFSLNPRENKYRYYILKRLVDIIGGIVGSIVAIILYVVLGILIKIESPGPIIFSQKRVGKNGRIFKMYKFRSMYRDAEERKKELMKNNEMDGLMFKMKDDPRITKIGRFIRKTSLDEFPQFFNVIKGDMSLVGTRPPTLDEYEKYGNHHKRRLSMRPGITGIWQVSGRSDITDFEEIVRMDCEYIDTWSFILDVSILLKTIKAVFEKKGAE